MPRPRANPWPTPGVQPSYGQPFGHAQPLMGREAEAPRYLGFGISFMVVYGLISLIFVVLAMLAPKVPELRALFAIIGIVGFVLLLYSVISGVLCIMRYVAGVWMGVALVSLGVLGGLINLVTKADIGSALFGLVINGGLLAAGIYDLRRYFAYKNEAAYPRPMAGYPGQGYGGYGGESGYAAPAVDYNQPYRKRAAPQAAQPQKPAGAMNLRGAVLNFLALAASIEPELAAARLERARTAAAKLMGEKYADEIATTLASVQNVVDPHARIAELGPSIASNAKLVESLRKCLVFVLAENNALTLAGEQFLSNYDISVDGSVAS